MILKKASSRNSISIVDGGSKEIIKSNHSIVPCYWWDTSLNFGDWIGPWIISLKFGKNAINTKNIKSVSNTIFSVGSIIHHLPNESGQITVWGSGLIKPISWRKRWSLKKKMKDVEFIAVRGRLTYQEITSKLKTKVPEVFGDPALLLPKYYQPTKKQATKIVLCPHYSHYDELKNKFLDYEDINVIDLKRDPRKVIDDITNAEICISSSLHGLIIAQTYGIPWIWLRFKDNRLSGDSFKFHDFYSTLKNCSHDHVSEHSIKAINYDDILAAANSVKLFELSIDLQLLDSALKEI
ncbi:polysaccharide pyruvyl transferase family protein [Acinetobacter lanii]|uniref:Polysaccharide pyruvyl transferase family protein n=1 Tax=Acinetobacter lanii TaxID=2715163 RepID=A0A6G8S1Q3_9GAMM|nr:polysaccharide pyruvyl transferase family protein [Acinetobacter lanii]QIO08020.1 polysaccharide pyruvyl transferase family protein [Acinetobacter lanii]